METNPFFLVPFLIFSTITCHINPENPSPSPLPSQLLTFLDQRLAVVYPIIQSFKNTITSDPQGITQSWVGSDICSYNGFYFDHPPDNLSATAVASVDFNGFHLAAPTLTGFIDQLPDLALFHANSNNFSGSISSTISSLPNLYELDISNNNFSGVFPASVLCIPSLSFLDIRYNSFTGSIPPQLFMQTLDALFVNNNKFTQTLPGNLGATTAVFLTLANNKFTGAIPRSIGNASSTLSDNYFTSVGQWRRKLVKSGVLDLRKNCILGLSDKRSAEDCALFFLHPKICPFPTWSFGIIPCHVSVPSRSRSAGRKKSKNASVSYGALSRHKL